MWTCVVLSCVAEMLCVMPWLAGSGILVIKIILLLAIVNKMSVLAGLVGCSKYSLYEVTVNDGVVKQRRLPDWINNLADRCSFFSRSEHDWMMSFMLIYFDRTDSLVAKASD